MVTIAERTEMILAADLARWKDSELAAAEAMAHEWQRSFPTDRGAQAWQRINDEIARRNPSPQAVVATTIALAETGERYTFVSALGSAFEATFVETGKDPLGGPTIIVADPTIKLTFAARDLDSIPAGCFVISVRSIRSMTLLPKLPPKDVTTSEGVDDEARMRSIRIAEEALVLLRSNPSDRAKLVEAERKLHEAANAAHWAAFKFSDALRAAHERTEAPRGSEGRSDAYAVTVEIGDDTEHGGWSVTCSKCGRVTTRTEIGRATEDAESHVMRSHAGAASTIIGGAYAGA